MMDAQERANAWLNQSVSQMDFDGMREALGAGANPNGSEPRGSKNPLGTPLAMAAACLRGPACAQAIDILLGAGADPDLAPLEWTPLALAAVNGNAAGVEALRGRSNRELEDRNGDAPWALAAAGGHGRCFDLLAPSRMQDLERGRDLAKQNGFDLLAESIEARALALREHQKLSLDCPPAPRLAKTGL